MSWKIRHAGSPKQVGDLTLRQIAQGLQDGEWDTDDEVMGPGDRNWVVIADHPELEDLAEALDIADENEDKITHDPEEDRIDMNPLIDVCLVLLVFFILATTMSIMEKVLSMPSAKKAQEAVTQLDPSQMDKMLIVEARVVNNRPTLKFDKQDVTLEALAGKLKAARDANPARTQVVIDAKDVEWQLVVNIISAAQAANITKVNFKMDPPKGPAASRPAGAGATK
jgi:biopolymer transport protein ExbD